MIKLKNAASSNRLSTWNNQSQMILNGDGKILMVANVYIDISEVKMAWTLLHSNHCSRLEELSSWQRSIMLLYDRFTLTSCKKKPSVSWTKGFRRTLNAGSFSGTWSTNALCRDLLTDGYSAELCLSEQLWLPRGATVLHSREHLTAVKDDPSHAILTYVPCMHWTNSLLFVREKLNYGTMAPGLKQQKG